MSAVQTLAHPLCPVGTGAEHPRHHFTIDAGIVRCEGFTETLCSWCDRPATRNLDTATDQCCQTHYAQWFQREEV